MDPTHPQEQPRRTGVRIEHECSRYGAVIGGAFHYVGVSIFHTSNLTTTSRPLVQEKRACLLDEKSVRQIWRLRQTT